MVEGSELLAKRPDPALVTVYLRALGELGYIGELADFMLSNERALIASGALELGLLALFAFTGQVALTNPTAYTRPITENPATRFRCATAPTK